MTDGDWRALVLIAAAGAIGWAAELAVNPRARCQACDGTGRHALSRKKAYGNCPKCKGTGRRLRFGAQWIRRDLRSGK